MKTKYMRDGFKIIDLTLKEDTPGKIDVFNSINLAKKKSTSLQMSNGGLGAGYVTVSK